LVEVFLRENEIGSKIAPHLERGQAVLDLGAGTGFISRWLRDRVGVLPTLTDVVSYRNREPSMPFITLDNPFHVPVPDRSFDVVMMLFVFHHLDRFDDQERLLDEALRITRQRLIVLEDTPSSRVDRAFNVFWDRLLNLRHRVPCPYTFRTAHEWIRVFKERDLSIVHSETYRALWPTLGMYHHSAFVLEA
jgi:ubiquinone/menaquinone biosynthesis C-methylase UbiE